MADTCMDSHISKQPLEYSSNLPSAVWNEQLRGSLLCRGNITPQVIEQLEKELDFYEKVSLVFLLYPNVDTALQFLRVAASAERNGSLNQSGLLSEWARTQKDNSRYWEAAFLEALCIVQNFQIVEKLGYQRNEVTERFLPDNPDISLNVDLMRKALYVMCEKLTLDQSRRLINLVTLDLGTEFPSFNSQESEYLEMHILYWLSQKYVIIHNRDVNLKNITRHLKIMEEFTLVEYLDSVAKRYATYGDDTDDQLADSSSVVSNCHPAHSVVSTLEMPYEIAQSSKNQYYIDPKNVGFCVIINQKVFYEETDPSLQNLLAPLSLDVRTGTDKDRDSLIEAFGNLGFKLQVWNDLTHLELIDTILLSTQKFVQDSHSCFVLCILSHGKHNAVYGVNSIAISVDVIQRIVHCPKLLGKPKVLIIQACQGQDQLRALPCNIHAFTSDIASDGPTPKNPEQTHPQISDMLILWSTVPGYASFRDKVKGTWYIQTLCDHLLQPTVEVDLLNVVLAVINSIQGRAALLGDGTKSMQPQFTGTLGKRLILPCSREARKSVAERMALRHLFDVMLDEYLRREFRQHSSLTDCVQ